MKRLMTLLAFALLTTWVSAQNFSDLVGKEETSEAFKTFVSAHSLEAVNSSRYQSGKGLEVVLKDGKVTEIHLHRESSIYGSFKEELPANLKFGMNSAEVKKLIGKPTTAYTSSGYNEYEYATYILSCWFENGLLSEVVLSAR
jgi:hypothetical protein